MTDLGWDIYCVNDLRPDMPIVSGEEAVAQAIARRLLTPPGGLWYDPQYGYGLQRWIGTIDPPVASIESAIRSEAMKDERVLDCVASVAFDSANSSIAVSFKISTDVGPFDLVLTVDAVSAAVLLEGVV